MAYIFCCLLRLIGFFFFNDTATTEIYTLSLHDALPISIDAGRGCALDRGRAMVDCTAVRSEEHTSELQSRSDLVCRLLLEKKKNNYSAAPQETFRAETRARRVSFTSAFSAISAP